MGVSSGDEDGGGVDGDGSGGNSPSRQGAETETSVPRILSSAAAELRNFSWAEAFVSSNSENISLIDFLKPKTAENRELALWHLVNRLVPENA